MVEFHWANWAIVLSYLGAIAGGGFWFMRRNRNSKEYFRGGGNIPWWAASLSLYAAMFSSITFLSIPALVYASDLTYLPIIVGVVPAALIAIRWYMPFFRKLNLTSAYEYLEVRFNLPCRLFASAAFILFMVVIAYRINENSKIERMKSKLRRTIDVLLCVRLKLIITLIM